jgi:hypothetical protein
VVDAGKVATVAIVKVINATAKNTYMADTPQINSYGVSLINL